MESIHSAWGSKPPLHRTIRSNDLETQARIDGVSIPSHSLGIPKLNHVKNTDTIRALKSGVWTLILGVWETPGRPYRADKLQHHHGTPRCVKSDYWVNSVDF